MEATLAADPAELPRRPLAATAVRLGALWIAAGACFKLFQGTPNDLPASVIEMSGLSIGLTYRLAIAIELSVAFVACLQPKWAWLPLAGAFVVFDVILIGMLGEDSCGCFGSSVTLKPETMLAIDTALLVLLLVTRPWGMARRRVSGLLVAASAAVGVALPWIFDREVRLPEGELTAVNSDGTIETVPENAWLELDIESWVGKSLYDTPLATYLDLGSVVPDGLWVLYRDTCDHCAKHLAELATSEVGERYITLVRLAERTDNEANRVVHLMPEGGFVQRLELPDSMTYFIQTPGEMIVENDVVVSAEEAVGGSE